MMIRVTICRDARSCVRCIKSYSVTALTGTDARPCVPTNRYTLGLPFQSLQRQGVNGDGRTTVRPLYQKLQRHGFNGDGRTTVRPYTSLYVFAVLQRTHRRSASDRASPQIVTRYGDHFSRYTSRVGVAGRGGRTRGRCLRMCRRHPLGSFVVTTVRG